MLRVHFDSGCAQRRCGFKKEVGAGISIFPGDSWKFLTEEVMDAQNFDFAT